jgi:hypothetical protein
VFPGLAPACAGRGAVLALKERCREREHSAGSKGPPFLIAPRTPQTGSIWQNLSLQRLRMRHGLPEIVLHLLGSGTSLDHLACLVEVNPPSRSRSLLRGN